MPEDADEFDGIKIPNPKSSSLNDLLEFIDQIADLDCPIDEEEDDDVVRDHNEASCPVCVARSACNRVASEIRFETVLIIENLKRKHE